jgi:hypothetical protein
MIVYIYIYVCVCVCVCVCVYGPPLWSSGQSSGYGSRGPDSIAGATRFSEIVGLERDPLRLVSTIEELLERKSSRSGLGNLDYGRR